MRCLLLHLLEIVVLGDEASYDRVVVALALVFLSYRRKKVVYEVICTLLHLGSGRSFAESGRRSVARTDGRVVRARSLALFGFCLAQVDPDHA